MSAGNDPTADRVEDYILAAQLFAAQLHLADGGHAAPPAGDALHTFVDPLDRRYTGVKHRNPEASIMRRNSRSRLILLVVPLAAARAQTLTSAENKLVASFNARTNKQLSALQKVVDIDSGTLNVAGVREVGRHFETELQGLGFRTRSVSMPEAMHRAGHLLAETPAVRPKPSHRAFAEGGFRLRGVELEVASP